MTSTRTTPLSVSAYHAEVDAAVARMDAILARSGVPAAVEALDRDLDGPSARLVLGRIPQGRTRLLDDARRELTEERPRVPSSPRDRSALVKILLLHQVDVMWWADLPAYEDAAAVAAADELVSLLSLRRAGQLDFRFAVQPSGLAGRARNRALRTLARRRRPQVTGVTFPLARPEVVGVLNELARTLRATAPTGTPALWVNSVVRTVELQRHLSELGYPALLPSSHCLGYAADIEMSWYERFGAAGLLRELLFDYRDRGVLNVIDEGQAWHLCLSPEHVADYRTSAPTTAARA